LFNAKVAKHKTSEAIVFNSMVGINIGNTELKVSANNKILLLALKRTPLFLLFGRLYIRRQTFFIYPKARGK